MALTAASSKSGSPFVAAIAPKPLTLKWRIALAYCAVVLALGILIIFIVNASMSNAVRAQIDRRLTLAAGELGDIAGTYLSMTPAVDVQPLAERYAGYDGVAYVFLEDRRGAVIAHSMKSFPSELEPRFPSDVRQVKKIPRRYHGRAVEETVAPLPEQSGAVHIGVWRDAIDAEVRKNVRPLIGFIAIVIAAALAAAIFLAHFLAQPIERLTMLAGKLSTGDLDTPLATDSNDEVGDLSRSLERMRASLKAAITLTRAR
jgi:HAMP domain-containing protein